jgi:signal transduction histidine kinase
LKQIIEESLTVLEPRISRKNIELHLEFKTVDGQISGDAQQMEQVFTNLINNALDAMPNGGVLTLNLAHNDQQQLQFKISDTGNGIRPDLLDQIFTPFYTTKSPDQGTGLGLYIVKNICKNHNAEIQCTSKPGQGTTFTITFRENERSQCKKS